jgi:hypothetical protein
MMVAIRTNLFARTQLSKSRGDVRAGAKGQRHMKGKP